MELWAASDRNWVEQHGIECCGESVECELGLRVVVLERCRRENGGVRSEVRQALIACNED